MVNKQSLVIKLMVFLVNLFIITALLYSVFTGIIKFEVFLAIVFLQVLVDGFFLVRYYLYKRFQRLAEEMGFQFITVFTEQSRIEGVYKDNWWQVHFASRPYGNYWGIPRTYIKLQYKEEKKFDGRVLRKYKDYEYKRHKINSIEHVTRPYKNYLLMKVMWYIFDKKKIYELMDFLLEVSKESEMK